jgi:hypothetical protein
MCPIADPGLRFIAGQHVREHVDIELARDDDHQVMVNRYGAGGDDVGSQARDDPRDDEHRFRPVDPVHALRWDPRRALALSRALRQEVPSFTDVLHDRC